MIPSAPKLDRTPGDVLISRMADPLGRACIFPGDKKDAVTVVDVCVFRPANGISARWAMHAINAFPFRQSMELVAAGTTRKRISRGNLEALTLGIPPLSEQRRMSIGVDSLFARSKKAKESLDRIPALLDRLKKSILAAAFRGDLTKDWREANPDAEQPAGHRYERGDTGIPGDVPSTWNWRPLPTLGKVARGKSKHRPRNDPALFGDVAPFIQTGDVARADGRIETFHTKLSEFGLAQSRLFPAGTVCITIAANIAASGVLAFDSCFPDSVVGVVVNRELVLPEYLEYFIRTARGDLARFAPATAQANINLEILSEVLVPVPPFPEMQAITSRIRTAFGAIQHIEAALEVVKRRGAALEAAILSRAFRGELVPQDPNDEPASVLLDRIRAEREGSQPTRKRASAGLASTQEKSKLSARRPSGSTP